jgi:hypothetical protein
MKKKKTNRAKYIYAFCLFIELSLPSKSIVRFFLSLALSLFFSSNLDVCSCALGHFFSFFINERKQKKRERAKVPVLDQIYALVCRVQRADHYDFEKLGSCHLDQPLEFYT